MFYALYEYQTNVAGKKWKLRNIFVQGNIAKKSKENYLFVNNKKNKISKKYLILTNINRQQPTY